MAQFPQVLWPKIRILTKNDNKIQAKIYLFLVAYKIILKAFQPIY